MNKKTAIGLFLIALTALSVASLQSVKAAVGSPQLQWEKTYGYFNGVMAIQTQDLGFAIVGTRADFVSSYEPYTNFSATLIKTDSSGTFQWQKNYLTPTGGNPQISQDANGHYLTGEPHPPIDSSGANAIFQTNDGGYVIAGTETWIYDFQHDGISITNGKWTVFFLLKTDADGNVVWHRTYNPGNGGNYSFIEPNNAILQKVIQTSDGGYALAGTINAGQFGWVVKTDSSGEEQWQQIYNFGGSNTYSQIYYIEETSDGYLLAGAFQQYHFFKTDRLGKITFIKNFSPNNSVFNTFFKGNNGNYLWAGYTRAQTSTNASILMIDAEGNSVSNNTYPTLGSFALGCATKDGYVLAQTVPLAISIVFASFNTTIAKVDESLNLEWAQTYGKTLDFTHALFVTSYGGLGLVGAQLEGYAQYKYDSTTYKSWVFLTKIAPFSSSPEPSPSVPEINLPVLIATAAIFTVAILISKRVATVKSRKWQVNS